VLGGDSQGVFRAANFSACRETATTKAPASRYDLTTPLPTTPVAPMTTTDLPAKDMLDPKGE